jgi:hypothetical protein
MDGAAEDGGEAEPENPDPSINDADANDDTEDAQPQPSQNP